MSLSIQIIAMLGTIISRTSVSSSSKTDSIIRCSSAATTPRCCARSTASRSSILYANSPFRKLQPGVSALPTTTNNQLICINSDEIDCKRSAVANEIEYAFWRPKLRGPTPITTQLTTTMAGRGTEQGPVQAKVAIKEHH